MKTKFLHLSKLLLSLLMPTTMMISCSYYDEEDATIIAYLKINDLLETKLEKTCEDEISAFENAAEAHEKIAAADFFGVYDVFGVAPDDEFLAYDEDAITSFYKKYYIDETESFNMKALEADISSELWTYINSLYADLIPAKAQNTEEGRYYTISELKEKYSDYKEVEIEDFSPMEIIKTVENEGLFDFSLLSDGEVNLHTLYCYYIHLNSLSEQEDKALDNLGYVTIIDSHFPDGIPDDFDTDAVIKLFQKLSTGDNPIYTNDLEGFEKFAFDYFETDMFTGEDL